MKVKRILVCAAIFLAVALHSVSAYDDNDKVDVKTIKGWPKEGENITMYSGNLAQEGQAKHIHYVFVKCQNQTGNHPMILWLNGGPGCSSMLGFAKEIGPVIVEDGQESWGDGVNPYAWSQFANLLFFDSPPGVGYSSGDPQKKEWTENMTALDALAALDVFYKKSSEMMFSDLYIAGEQYGGVYAPWLARAILGKTGGTQFPLKGLILANAIVNPLGMDDQYYQFLYGRQLINLDTWEIMNQACKVDPNAPRCVFARKRADEAMVNLNLQDITRECYFSDPEPPGPVLANDPEPHNETQYECVDSVRLRKAFKDSNLEKALHVTGHPLGWVYCNDEIMNSYKQATNGSFDVMFELMNGAGKLKFLVYHGDTDAEVPVNSAEDWINKLTKIEERRKVWGEDGKTYGYVEKYKNDLTFATIRGVGQSAAQWKRRETFTLVSKWINNQNIAK